MFNILKNLFYILIWILDQKNDENKWFQFLLFQIFFLQRKKMIFLKCIQFFSALTFLFNLQYSKVSNNLRKEIIFLFISNLNFFIFCFHLSANWIFFYLNAALLNWISDKYVQLCVCYSRYVENIYSMM